MSNSSETFPSSQPLVFDDKRHIEKAILALATTTSSKDYESFLQFCVKTLAEFYRCRHAFVGLLNPEKTQLTTQAVWSNEGYRENFAYALAGTPCQEIVNFSREMIPSGVAERYPDDKNLLALGVDSYFGAPIIHSENGVIGIVAVMDGQPLRLNECLLPVLGAFAARLSSEIHNHQNLVALQEMNACLAQRMRKRSEDFEIINHDLREFTAAVAHDLRAPIRNINGYLDILLGELAPQLSPDVRERATRIHGNAVNLDRIISDLLTLSGVNKNPLLIKKLDINSIITEELRFLQESDPSRVVYVEMQEAMNCWGDEALIRLLWQNLLANAWKYTAKVEQPQIYIQQETIKDKTVFSIRDNGAGFEAEKSDLLFKPFKRLHASSEFPGNGVGLATVQKIVKRHKGAIWASSQTLEGASFYFYLGCSDKSLHTD